MSAALPHLFARRGGGLPANIEVSEFFMKTGAYLERLGLTDAHSFKDMFIRKLFAGNL